MAQVYSNHCTEIALDFGVIGDQYVDVIYDWHEANPTNDRFQVPEPAYPDIKDVLLFVDGHEVSAMHWLSPSRIEELCDAIREKWE